MRNQCLNWSERTASRTFITLYCWAKAEGCDSFCLCVCFNLPVELLLSFLRYSALLHFSKHNESKWMQHCRIVQYFTHTQNLLIVSIFSWAWWLLNRTKIYHKMLSALITFNSWHFFGLGETSYWCNLISEIRSLVWAPCILFPTL